MIKLVLTDMDGTLLPAGWSRVSDYGQAAIRALWDADVLFGPASGRDYGDVISFFDNDPAFMRHALLSNGQKIYVDGQLEKTVPYNKAALERLKNLIDATEGVLLSVPVDTRHMLVMGEAAKRWQNFPSNWFPTEIRVTDELPEGKLAKAGIACEGDEARTQEVLELFTREIPEIRFVSPITGWLDLVVPGWSKAEGVKWLCARLGIGLDEVCVFGDSANDAEMLELVDYSVVVADGTAEAQRAARFSIGQAADDAVAEAFFAIAEASTHLTLPAFLQV